MFWYFLVFVLYDDTTLYDILLTGFFCYNFPEDIDEA